MKRPVKIKPIKGAYLVLYVDRKKGQRYCAACFSFPVTLQTVIDWIAAKPNLKLI